MTPTEAYSHGYLAGYNQALVDRGFMTQDKADRILRKAMKPLPPPWPSSIPEA